MPGQRKQRARFDTMHTQKLRTNKNECAGAQYNEHRMSRMRQGTNLQTINHYEYVQ